MKVFISWSGDRSKAVAELLDAWIRCVLQSARPWLSTKNIDRGALWLTEINKNLQDTQVGIICLTADNRDRPWILFEAGALAKGLSTNRVCTFLIDLKPQDITDPLAQFNHTEPTEDGVRKLLLTLNNALGDARLDEHIVNKVFETYWPGFKADFEACLKALPQTVTPAKRPDNELLTEILETTRSLQHRMNRLELPAPAGERRTRPSDDLDPNDTLAADTISPSSTFKLISRLAEAGISDDEITSQLVRRGVPRPVSRAMITAARPKPRESSR